MHARSFWGRLGTLLRKEGADPRVSEKIYRAVEQAILLGPVVSNHGSLRAVPAPVARGWNGPQDHRYMPI